MSEAWVPARVRHVPEFKRTGVRGSRYSRALGEAICERIAGGETKASICADPDMPSQPTIYNWARAHPEFGARHAAAVAQAVAGQRAKDRDVEAGKAWRRARTRKWAGRGSEYTPEVGEAVCRAIAAGASCRQIDADKSLPSSGCIYRWLRRHPDFAVLYAQAREDQAHGKFDLAWEIAQEATEATVRVARLQFDVLRWQVACLAPKKYGRRQLEEDAAAEQPLVVVIRRFSQDDDDLEAEIARATEALAALPPP
jgi:hypothetical protein